MIVGGCRSVFSHLLTTKMRENRPWMRRCVCGELQVATAASKGEFWATYLFLLVGYQSQEKRGQQKCFFLALNAPDEEAAGYDAHGGGMHKRGTMSGICKLHSGL